MSQDNAGQEPVKKPEEVVENKQPIATEVDPEAEMAKIIAENKRLSTERDNYRKGMLKAKGKLPEEVEPDEDSDDKMRKIVQEELSKTNYASAQQRLEEQALKLARENKELKKALGNRSQISSTNQVSNQEGTEIRDSAVSPEKERALLDRFSGNEEAKKRKLAEWKKNRLHKA